jgi:cytochrome c-type biogenesis protein CcmF
MIVLDIPSLGHAALWTALVLSLGHVWAFTSPARLFLTRRLALVQFVLVTAAFAALINAYAESDFSVLSVILNSHSAKPMLYKITGSWGNHEGSMLLWIWVLSAYGLGLAWLRPADANLQLRTLGVHGLISGGMLLYVLFVSNPFLRVFPPAPDGQDLNPLLQDIGLALHPPMLYTGYVGFAIVFAAAMAGLARGRLDGAWAKATQPWILLAWGTLTLGIGLGSWWAYRELGWGGWWFWDPVENVSLLPWLTATALLHANRVLERRGEQANWVALLSLLTFTMSLIGTFIVRSGLLVSVHSFASDPARGIALLIYVSLVVASGLWLFSRVSFARHPDPSPLLSRTGGIVVNNILLLTLCGTVLLALFTPVFFTLFGLPAITVGAPYFNTIIPPLALPLVALAGIAPLLPWEKSAIHWPKFAPLGVAAAGAILIVLLLTERDLLLAMAGASASAVLLMGTCLRARRGLKHQASLLLSHGGMAILTLAITVSSLSQERYEMKLDSSGTLTLGEYRLTLDKAEKLPEANYTRQTAHFTLTRDGETVAKLAPEIRQYPVREMETSEVALDSGLWRDLYLVIGHTENAHTIGVRFYVMPGMLWLWLGFGLIAAGGLVGAATRLWQMREVRA